MTFKFQLGQRVTVVGGERSPYVEMVLNKFGNPIGKTGFVMQRRSSAHGVTANWYHLDCFDAWLHERVLTVAQLVPVGLSTWGDFRQVMHEAGEELDPSKKPIYMEGK